METLEIGKYYHIKGTVKPDQKVPPTGQECVVKPTRDDPFGIVVKMIANNFEENDKYPQTIQTHILLGTGLIKNAVEVTEKDLPLFIGWGNTLVLGKLLKGEE